MLFYFNHYITITKCNTYTPLKLIDDKHFVKSQLGAKNPQVLCVNGNPSMSKFRTCIKRSYTYISKPVS